MKKLFYILAVCLIPLIFSTSTTAQSNTRSVWLSDQQAIDEIKANFNNHDWDRVISSGEKFRTAFPRSKFSSTVTILVAQAALNMRDVDLALLEVKFLFLKYPNSKYIDNGRMVLAEASLMAEKWSEAREYLSWIVSFSTDDKLVKTARSWLDELDQYLDQSRMLSQKEDDFNSSAFKVSLVLPFTGADSTATNEFQQGFKIYWDSAHLGELEYFDTADDPVRAALITQQAIREGAWAIVGGMNPSEAATLASICEAEETPFVTTTCPVEGVAAIGRNVFQGRSDYAVIGRKLARHAISMMGLGQFGLLVPGNQEGRQIARSFEQDAAEAGVEILAEEFYYPGTQDFKTYFARMRQIGLRRAYDDSLKTFFAVNGYLMKDTTYVTEEKVRAFYFADSIRWMDRLRYIPLDVCLDLVLPPEGIELEPDELPGLTLSQSFLDSLWEFDHRRIRGWMVENKKDVDSLEIPLNIFDGFLFVIEPGMVQMVAPQFARSNIKTQLLGNESWGDAEALSKNSGYVDGLIFAEPIAGVGGEEYYKFAEAVAGDSMAVVSPFHLLGERAARMIAFGARHAANRAEMRQVLSQIRYLKTLSGEVSLLKEERVDRNVEFKQFINGHVETVSEIRGMFSAPE